MTGFVWAMEETADGLFVGLVCPDGPLLENGTVGQPKYQFTGTNITVGTRVTFDLEQGNYACFAINVTAI